MLSENNTGLEKDYAFRFRYETLRSLLNQNGNALQLLSDLEADLNHMRHFDRRIKRPIQRLITESLLMAQELNLMTRNHYRDLYDVIFGLRNDVDQVFSGDRVAANGPLVVGLDGTESEDPALVGGKACGVARLHRSFPDLAPPGFVATTSAYYRIIEDNDLHDRIRIMLDNLDVTEDQDRFSSQTRAIRRMLNEATVNSEIETAIRRQAEQISGKNPDLLWAVRSSAVYEDGPRSFAGQFDSELQVRSADLITAYRHVLSSRFTDRAVKYRIYHNLREIDSPMAVLFMPMVVPAAAGVVYTVDVGRPDSDDMIISAVPGLANHLVRGEVWADTAVISKRPAMKINRIVPAGGEETAPALSYLTNETLLEIARLAGNAETRFGHPLDIEWVVDKQGAVRFVQARRLNPADSGDGFSAVPERKDDLPVIESGMTIFPGRAEGPVVWVDPEDSAADVPEGAVVLVEQPRPELAALLPKIGAFLVVEGDPVGHLATLIREFAVPCLFRMGKNAAALTGKKVVSVNATRRRVYIGSRWPGMRERVLARIAAGNRHQKKSGPLYNLVLGLNLLDPDARSFKAKSCRSVHDTLRFMHEMSVRSMFGFGDKQNRAWNKKTRKLATDLPIKFQLIDLDRSVSEKGGKVVPESVASVPFQALWRGVSDSRLGWPERWDRAMRGMPADFKEAVLGGNKGPRRPADRNYAVVAGDYMNINARFAYHYAMIDAMVGPGSEHNHVHFRFRGGGAGEDNRKRRARFLERVLRKSGFGVDRSGDLVTAWFRRYPREDSERALECLGRLIVCARQLDAVLRTDEAVTRYAAYFLDGEFMMFA